MAEAHGGYICRIEGLESVDLWALASQALAADVDGPTADANLQVSVIARRKVVRFAYDAPFTYGQSGALWYQTRHSLARLLSQVLGVTLHAYVFDPGEFELVSSYGNGRPVGGEALRCEDAELPDDGDGELDDHAFERLKDRWPLGHLAHVFGVTRAELEALPRASSLLLNLAEVGPDRLRRFDREFAELFAAPEGRWGRVRTGLVGDGFSLKRGVFQDLPALA